MDIDSIAAQIIKDLQATDRLRRKHASFWNFHRKGPKEFGVFTEALRRIESDYGAKIESWAACNPDPPDITFQTANVRIGVEITELVNELALNAQLHDPAAYSMELLRYGVSEAKSQLKEIVIEKEKKVKSVAQNFNSLVLLLHTDEPMISSDHFLDYHLPVPSNIFERIYLLFSHDPAKSGCPIVRLQ